MLAVALAMVTAPAVNAPALAAPEPNGVSFDSLAYGGNGCPQGTVAPVLSDDGTHFRVSLNGLVAGSAWRIGGPTANKTMSFSGPVVQDFQLVHTVRIVDLINLGFLSNACSYILNFKATANVLGPTSAPAELSVGSIDGTLAGAPLLSLPCS